MAMSYLDNEDEQSFTIRTPSGGVVQYQKQPNYNVAGGVYDVAAKAAAQMKPAAPIADSSAVFNTTPQVAFPTPPVDLPPYDPTKNTAADPAARQAAAMPQMNSAVASKGGGSSVVRLGTTQDIQERPATDMAAVDRYESEQRKSTEHLSKAVQTEGRIATEKGEAAKQQALIKTQMGQTREEAANKAQTQFLDYQRNFDKLQKDYQSTEIRPAGYFEGNLGGNLLAGIGIMLGAVGGALQGTGKNAATDVIDRAIDRDLQAQKSNLDKKREVMSVLGQQYQAARQAGFDDTQSRMLAKADAYDAVASYMEAKVAPLQGQVIQERGLAEVAQKRADANKLRIDVTSKGTDKHIVSGEDKIMSGSEAKPVKVPEHVSTAIDKQTNTNDTIQSLRELVQTQKAMKTGYFNSLAQETKAKFGLQDGDEAAAYQKLKSLIQERINFLTGSGSGVVERVDITKTLPGLVDNPDAFFAKLDSLDEANATAYYRAQQRYPDAENKWIELSGPGAQRARVTVFGKESTFKKN